MNLNQMKNKPKNYKNMNQNYSQIKKIYLKFDLNQTYDNYYFYNKILIANRPNKLCRINTKYNKSSL